MNRTLRTGGLVFAGMIAATLASPTCLADGVIRDGLGAISTGRGGTNIGHSDNIEIMLDNPAGMTNARVNGMLQWSADVLATELDYSDPENDNISGEVLPYPMGQVGGFHRDPSGNWAAGFGIFTPAGFGTQWDVNHPILGPQRQKSLGALVKFLPAAAVKLTDRTSIGAACGLALSHASLDGPFHLQSGPIPGAPTLLDLDTTGVDLAWNVGLQHQLGECTTLGITYTAETRVSQQGEATANVPGLGFSSFDADLDIAWPRSVGVGLVHAPCRHHRYSLDVLWFNWSDAFDSFDMTFTNFSNPAFSGLLGTEFSDSIPLLWRDTVSLRTGYEYFLDDGQVWRLGYVYHRNPIPAATLTTYIPAILEHAVAIGYGKQTCCWNYDVAYQYSWGPSESVGTSAILGGDFDNSRTDAAAHWISFSLLRKY